MPRLVILYWRDIPSQVIVKAGRASAKRELSKRFIEAIDRAAMRSGASGTDDYLPDWRRADPVEIAGELETTAQAAADRIESEYDAARLRALSDNGGRGV